MSLELYIDSCFCLNILYTFPSKHTLLISLTLVFTSSERYCLGRKIAKEPKLQNEFEYQNFRIKIII